MSLSIPNTHEPATPTSTPISPPAGFVIEGGTPGGFQGGGPGGGGQVFTQDLDPDQIATLQAERGGQTPGGGRAGLFLIDPLLEVLEAKVGA